MADWEGFTETTTWVQNSFSREAACSTHASLRLFFSSPLSLPIRALCPPERITPTNEVFSFWFMVSGSYSTYVAIMTTAIF